MDGLTKQQKQAVEKAELSQALDMRNSSKKLHQEQVQLHSVLRGGGGALPLVTGRDVWPKVTCCLAVYELETYGLCQSMEVTGSGDVLLWLVSEHGH